MSSEAGGRAPGKRTFEAATGIRESQWSGLYWSRWSDAVREAGYAPNTVPDKTPESVVLARMATVVRYYGRIPTVADLKLYARSNPDGVNPRLLDKRFGGKTQVIEALRSWASSQDGYEDVLAILGTTSVNGSAPTSSLRDGYVYLVKSGSHYKIGRSDEIERRMKEIRIVQPEATDLVHTIRTDDPSGIESYWHRRFADRRANGEWFKLSASDVAAFKRRKYQ